jgi:hypothetical protein
MDRFEATAILLTAVDTGGLSSEGKGRRLQAGRGPVRR